MPNSEGKKRPIGQVKTSQKRKQKPEYTRVNVAGVETMEDWDRAQEEKYGMLVQNIPCAVYSACPGKGGPTTFVSNKWKDWTGYSPEELYHDPEAWARCIHRDDREHAVNTYIEACRDRMAYNLEYRIVHKDTGQLRYVRDQGHLSKDKKGAVVRVDGIVTDITELKKANNELEKYRNRLEELVKKRTAELTSAYETLKVENKERKRAEQALREVEREKTTVLESLSDLMVYRDRNMVTLLASKSMANWHGMSQDQIIGRVCYKARYGREEPCEKCHIVEAMESGQRQELEKQLPDERFWHVTVNPVFSDSGQVIGTIEVSQDITERKQSEEALRETTDLLETIFEHTHMLVAYLDAQFNFVRVNRAYAEADKHQTSFFPGRNHFDLYPNTENQEIFRKVVETGQPYFAYAKPFEYAEHPERGISYWDWSLVPIKDQQGIVSGLVLTVADVTARKRAEEALKASEGKLNAMLQSISDHMSMMDKDLNIIWANEKAMNIFGDDIVGRKCYEAYHGRNKPCEPHPCLTFKAFQDGMVHEHDTQVVDKDGNTRYFHCSANVALRDEQGKPTAVLEISEDITDQKLAEEALRESESSYRAVVENAAEGIIVVQGQTLQFVNPAVLSMTGYSEKELLTRPFIEFVHPDHKERAMGIHIKRLKGEEVPPVYELKVLDKKGNTIWVENNGILIEWRDKPATLNFLRDVTERKKAEQVIWASESEKRSILNAISDHILFHDTDLLIRWGNEAAARSVGMTQRELVGRHCYELWQGRSEPCERCPVIRAIETCSHTEGLMTTPDGKCWEIIGEPVLDRDGEIRGAIEIGRDITERKKDEESLKCRMEFERLLTMLSKRFIDPGDIDGKIIEALKSIGEFAGVDRAYIFQLRDNGRTADNTHEWCAGGIEPKVENLKGITLDDELPWFWEKVRAHETFHVPVVADLPPEAHLEKAHFEMQGIQALVVVPMLSKGVLKGFLGFDSMRSQKTWPQDIIAMLSIASENISLALDREHAEQRARLLSSTVEQSSEGMSVVDLQGSILFLNHAFAAMHGYTPGELVGKHMSIFHTQEQMPSVEAANRRTKETGDFNGEIWHLRRDGTFFPGLMHSSLLRDDEGNPIGLIGTLRDITESKKAEQALKESEIKFRSITEESLVGVYVIQDGVFKYINPKFAEIFGYSVDELINKKGPYELVHPDDWPASKENLRKRIAGELKSIRYAFRGITKDKKVIHLEVYGSATEYQGHPAVIGTLLDITERVLAEQALQESEEHFRAIFENALVGLYRTTPDGRILMANPALVQMLGYSSFEELAQLNLEEEGFALDCQRSVFKQRVEAEDRIVGLESRWMRRDGTTLFVRESARIVRDKDGEILYYEGTVADLTERKKAEEELRIREQKLRALLNAPTESAILADTEGTILDINRIAAQRLGKSAESLIGMGIYDYLPADIAEYRINQGYEVVRSGKPVRFQDDREGRYYDTNIYPVFDDEGKVSALAVFSGDITERKRAHEKLRENEMRFRQLVENIREVFWMENADGTELLYVSPAYEEIWGRSCEEFYKNPKVWIDAIHPDDRERVEDAFAKGRLDGTYSEEFRIIRPDGTIRWIWDRGVLIRNEFDEVIRVAGVAEDITERKQTEKALRESEEKFRSLAEQSPNMIFIHSKGRVVYANKKCEEVMGYKREELCSPDFDFRILIAPESLEMVSDNFTRHLRGEEVQPYDYTIVRKDGKRIEAINTSKLIQYEGETAILGIVTDITERKRAEQALRESEERLKILFESAPDTIYLIDPEGRFVDGNRAAMELIGFARDEVIGKSLAEMGLLSAEQLTKAEANLKKATNGKLSGPNEYDLKRKDGSHISVEVRTFPVKIGGKTLSLGIARDITEHKRTEKELLEHQSKLKSLASQLSLTEERERHRLATDLHDQISQSLVISKIKLDQLRKSSTSDEFNEPLEDICNCLGQIIDDTRALTFDLSYPILYELGFEAAVAEWLTDQIQEKHGIRTEFVDDGHQKPLDDDIRVLLFRNVRELLINVVKHAQANKVKVSIRKVKDNIRVGVEDDGVGFDPVEVASMAAKRAEFGLFSIRERLEQLGGLIEIDSEMGHGSKITMTAPLKYDNSTDRTHK